MIGQLLPAEHSSVPTALLCQKFNQGFGGILLCIEHFLALSFRNFISNMQLQPIMMNNQAKK